MDVAGQPLALPGRRLDLQRAGEGALGGAGDLDDVADGDGGDPDEDHVVDGVAGRVAALEQVGGGDRRGGERGPAPAALDGEREDGTGGPYRRQGGAAAVDVVLVDDQRGQDDAGDRDREVDGEEALGARGRVLDAGQRGERPEAQDDVVGDGDAGPVELVVLGGEEPDRVQHGEHPVAGQGTPQRLLDRHAHDAYLFGHLPHPRPDARVPGS
ncbi:hypothetical protein M2156_006298 [Streptomyces sp. SAI-149]|nr:hypothetical protein [Streptomyces sp. SAI-149]